VGLFDRFVNPVWHDISRLDADGQRIAAFLLTGYGSCRYQINEYLVSPLNLGSASSSVTKEKLIDEALVAFLKSCRVPQSDLAGNIPDQIVRNVTEVWGTFALADCNHRLNRSNPETLAGSAYSADPDEARTQVLVRWAEILEITQPDFVMNANRHWFLEQWTSMITAMIAGSLTGFGRVPVEIALKRAKSEAASLPSYQLAKARYMIQGVAKISLSLRTTGQRIVPGVSQSSPTAAHSLHKMSSPTAPKASLDQAARQLSYPLLRISAPEVINPERLLSITGTLAKQFKEWDYKRLGMDSNGKLPNGSRMVGTDPTTGKEFYFDEIIAFSSEQASFEYCYGLMLFVVLIHFPTWYKSAGYEAVCTLYKAHLGQYITKSALPGITLLPERISELIATSAEEIFEKARGAAMLLWMPTLENPEPRIFGPQLLALYLESPANLSAPHLTHLDLRYAKDWRRELMGQGTGVDSLQQNLETHFGEIRRKLILRGIELLNTQCQ
jgi:hypothetical protein